MENLLENIINQGPWAALAVWYVIQKKDEDKKRDVITQLREDRLMTHLEKTNESHEKIVKSLEGLERRMEALENRIKSRIENRRESNY